MIISINPVEHTIDINSNNYYPIHGFIKIRCQENDCDYTIIAQVQQTYILEDYIQLRKQTTDVVPNKYMTQLYNTELRYVVTATPILIVNNKEEKSKKIKNKNIFIELERSMQKGEAKPHLMQIDENQDDIPDILKSIFPSEDGIFLGNLLYGETPVYIPVKYLPYHISIFGITGSGKSNLMQVFIDSVLRYNINQLFYSTTGNKPPISIIAIDPHDEYAFGTEQKGKGLQHFASSLSSEARCELMGNFYYLYPHGSRIRNELSPYAREILIRFDEIMPSDLLSVRSFNDKQAELMEATYHTRHGAWINDILTNSDQLPQAHEQTVPAVNRRLRVLERSHIFQNEGESSLLDIIDALDTGKILDFNASLLSDFEQFLFNSVVARTLFNIRQALKSSTTQNEFIEQLQSRLPTAFFERFMENEDRIARYIAIEDRLKDPAEMPIVVITVEEAPSLLNPDMMRGQNVFKDISRQGRKFNLGLCVISQQITTLDNAIMANLNTMIHLPIGSDYERMAAIKNATSSITKEDLKSLEGTIGIAIISGIWLTNFQKIQIPLYSSYFNGKKDELRNIPTRSSNISI